MRIRLAVAMLAGSLSLAFAPLAVRAQETSGAETNLLDDDPAIPEITSDDLEKRAEELQEMAVILRLIEDAGKREAQSEEYLLRWKPSDLFKIPKIGKKYYYCAYCETGCRNNKLKVGGAGGLAIVQANNPGCNVQRGQCDPNRCNR